MDRGRFARITQPVTEETMDRPFCAPRRWTAPVCVALLVGILYPAEGRSIALAAVAEKAPRTSAAADDDQADSQPMRPVPGSLLLPPDGSRPRSRHLELIAREADRHSRRAFELAGRKAYFSARAQFIMALRLLAQALDAEHQTQVHSQALATGLRTLKEAEDFIPGRSKLEADLDLPEIVRTHRTPVLQGVELGRLTPLDAMQCYHSFAQEQLGLAGGGEVASSMALYGLGKLHKALAEQGSSIVQAARPKAVVYYQAALLVCRHNYMASNDLGVMLAQAGRYEEARMALEHSLSVQRHSAGWHNLGVVYQQLGRTELAGRAFRLAEADREAQLPGLAQATRGPVQWVDSQTFAQAHNLGGRHPGSPPHRSMNVPRQSPKAAAEEHVAQDWLPWSPLDTRK